MYTCVSMVYLYVQHVIYTSCFNNYCRLSTTDQLYPESATYDMAASIYLYNLYRNQR